ncbi:MAG: hypothetical protein ACJ0A6_02325 [Dehalococcoidia bacterium]
MGTALSSLLVTAVVLTTVLLVYQAKTSGQTLVHEANRQAAYRIQNANATQLDIIPVENSVFENDVPGPATTEKIVYKTWTPNAGIASYQIRMMNLDGTDVTQVTTNTTHYILYPRLSPDGTKIVYSARPIQPAPGVRSRYQIYIINTDGTNLQQITFPDGIDSSMQRIFPAWHPDGTKLLYSKWTGKNYDNCIINVDGTNEVCFETPSPTGRTGTREFSADWTPDGSKIVFSSYEYVQGLPNPYVTNVVITIMDSDGTNVQILTDPSIRSNGAKVSPDGTKIVYECPIVGPGVVYPSNTHWRSWSPFPKAICTMNIDGTNKATITTNTSASNYFPSWSPDGSKIIFSSLRDKPIEPNPWAPSRGISYRVTNVYSMNPDGSDETQLTSELPFGNNWTPTTGIIPSGGGGGGGGTSDCGLDFWIKNTGESSISGYEYMDAILVLDGTIDPILLKYSKSAIADLKVDEWTATIPDTDINELDELYNNNSYQVDVLNNGEYMRVTLKIARANKSSGTVIFSSPNGKFVTRQFQTTDVPGEIVLRCGGLKP